MEAGPQRPMTAENNDRETNPKLLPIFMGGWGVVLHPKSCQKANVNDEWKTKTTARDSYCGR